MNSQQYIGWQEEVERCARLYEGFADAAPFVRAVYQCIDRFLEDYHGGPELVIDPEEAAGRFRAGRSLEVNPALDTKYVVGLLGGMSEAVVEVNPDLKGAVKAVKEDLERFLLDSPDRVSKDDVWGLCHSLVKEAHLEQDLATFLFSTALSFSYRQYLQSAAGALRTDLWSGGNCPLCGERPHYGSLRRDDGAKELECWLCGTKWVHTRIKCPFCNDEEQDDLGYFTAENQEICRINFCRRCHQYSKIIDARKLDAKSDIILAIHNLASLSHDLLARQEGFTPGSGLEWVNPEEIAGRREALKR